MVSPTVGWVLLHQLTAITTPHRHFHRANRSRQFLSWYTLLMWFCFIANSQSKKTQIQLNQGKTVSPRDLSVSASPASFLPHSCRPGYTKLLSSSGWFYRILLEGGTMALDDEVAKENIWSDRGLGDGQWVRTLTASTVRFLSSMSKASRSHTKAFNISTE